MKRFSLNQKLAASAFVMALFSLLLAFASPDGINNTNQSPSYISVVDLADRIRNRKPVQIIDLRSEALYETFHVPTASSMPLKQGLQTLEITSDTLVFYSGDDPLARSLWGELPDSLKTRSYILYGGVHDWYERLLYPELPAKYNKADSTLYMWIHDLSLFYGGQPEFVQEEEALKYYRQDFKRLPWPKSHRQNGLVRKGC